MRSVSSDEEFSMYGEGAFQDAVIALFGNDDSDALGWFHKMSKTADYGNPIARGFLPK